MRRLPLVAAVALMLVGVVWSPAARAAIVRVDTALDNNERDSVLSLREAMLLATGRLGAIILTPAEQDNVGRNVGAAFADTIVFDATVFPPSAPVTITLRSTLPTLETGRDTIDAGDAGVRLDGRGLLVGIVITSDENVVHGLAIARCTVGVSITSGSANVIGGHQPGEGNVVVDNQTGVSVEDEARGNVVAGNHIGTDAASSPGLGNVRGVHVSFLAEGTTIEGNVVSGNEFGLLVRGRRNVVRGNLVGTDVSGDRPIGNAHGIFVNNGENQIGGPEAADRNVVSGNGTGIRVDGGRGNRVQGNFVGTDVSGRLPLANDVGIALTAVDDALAGGAVPGEGNLVSANTIGILVAVDAASNLVLGNRIGTDVDGALPLGNGTGVLVRERARSIAIGQPGAGNLIAFNGTGVALLGDGGGSTIAANAIHSNTDLGIDLGGDGVTPNDPGDADVGPNGLQNFPALATAALDLEDAGAPAACDEGTRVLTVAGTFEGAAMAPVTIELYASAACDATGHGEGGTSLGPAGPFVTGADGSVDFTIALPLTQLPGGFITATATGPDGSTSEFSECVEVAGISTAATSCDDGDPCTADLCDPLAGCVPEPLDGAGIAGCDDGSFCNGAEQCVAGACRAGPAPDCDDGDLCTVNLCDAAVGCATTARIGFESVTCRLDTMDELLAGAADVPAKPARKLGRRIAGVRRKVDAAAGTERPRRAGRKLAAAGRKLGRLAKTIARLRKGGKVDPALLDALEAAAADATGRLGAIQQP